jgi:hypothetical protein
MTAPSASASHARHVPRSTLARNATRVAASSSSAFVLEASV